MAAYNLPKRDAPPSLTSSSIELLQQGTHVGLGPVPWIPGNVHEGLHCIHGMRRDSVGEPSGERIVNPITASLDAENRPLAHLRVSGTEIRSVSNRRHAQGTNLGWQAPPGHPLAHDAASHPSHEPQPALRVEATPVSSPVPHP